MAPRARWPFVLALLYVTGLQVGSASAFSSSWLWPSSPASSENSTAALVSSALIDRMDRGTVTSVPRRALREGTAAYLSFALIGDFGGMDQ